MHGYLIIDKPQGITSTQCVGAVKRLWRQLGLNEQFGKLKIGHGGTLDPLATGVLPLALGEATKTISYVLTGDKAYDFTVTWGVATDSQDSDGAVTATSDVRPTRAQIESVLPGFIGTIMQTPPVYSALKIDGQRAYDLARAGEHVEMTPRAVQINALTLLDATNPDQASFHVACGKGTYVRSIARDLANKLGTEGHISVLKRTNAGPFGLNQAISLEKLLEISDKDGLQTVLLPLATALDDIPALAVTAGEAGMIRHGQSISFPPLPHIMARNFAPGDVVLMLENEVPVALCEACDMTSFQPLRVFNL